MVVLSGGSSAEREISLKTGRVVFSALDKNKYDITSVVIPRNNKLALPRKPIDVAFIAMHGSPGEDGVIQGFLDLAGVPYTGSGVLASALAMDKIKSTHLFSSHGLKVPKHTAFSRNKRRGKISSVKKRIKKEIGLPCVIKPANSGSSVGISVVKKDKDLQSALARAFRESGIVMAEEYIQGTELTCAVLDDEKIGEPFALPPTQIIPKTSEFFDYKAKYIRGASEEITPPRLPKKNIKQIQNAALKAHAVLGCSGMSRTDMILTRNGEIFVLETNTIPGMTETSLLPQAAQAAGISFPELLDKIIGCALKKRTY